MKFLKKPFLYYLLVLIISTSLIGYKYNSDSHNITSNPEEFADDAKAFYYPPQETAKKVVYLTFDDGPTMGITDKLLDVLKEYNVKATFFVVGKEIKGREYLIKRIYNEGHSIGLHTFTHNFNRIYSS